MMPNLPQVHPIHIQLNGFLASLQVKAMRFLHRRVLAPALHTYIVGCPLFLSRRLGSAALDFHISDIYSSFLYYYPSIIATPAIQGYSNRQIAKMLPVHRETVARYKQEDRIPVRGGDKKYSAISYENFILQRWQERCHSPKQIFLEIQVKGFTGSLSSTYWYLIYLGMQNGQPGQKLQPRRLTAG